MSQYTVQIDEPQSLAATYAQLLPLGADKTDIFDFHDQFSPNVTRWFNLCLTQKAWEMDVHLTPQNAAFFRHLYFESKNVLKTRGQHTLGFGYPLVFDKKNDGEAFVAPLFVWYLTVRPSPNRHDSWIFSFDDNSPIAVNDYFVAHCLQKYGLTLGTALQAITFDRPFETISRSFSTTCEKLAEKLHFSYCNLSPVTCNAAVEMIAANGGSGIVGAGALGLFPHQMGSLADSQVQETDFQNFTWTAEHTHEFAPLPEDAYQREALRTILRNKMTLVEGGHGTGKTYLAANLVLNALSNGQKVAVVSEDTGSLLQIQNQLVNLNLGNLTFLLRDVYHDKNVLLDTLRGETAGKNIDFKTDDFNIALKQARRLLGKSDDSHAALSQPIFGAATFAEVVGMLQKSRREAGEELLANHLSAKDFEFELKEHTALSAAVTESQALFNTVGTLKHPLSALSPTVFEHKTSEKGYEFAAFELAVLTESWKALHHRHITLYDQYAQKLMAHYEHHHDALRTQVRLLREAYSDFQFQFGTDFEDNSLLRLSGLRTSALFSNRSKNILTAKDDVLKQYETLEKMHNGNKYFSHNFLKKSEQKDFKKLQTNLETFNLSLKSWRKSLATVVQEELQRLNAKTSQYFDKNMSAAILDLETDLDRLTKSLNSRQLYAASVEHKMLTLPKRMQFIEETLEKLSETQLYLPQFGNFYAWQKHWIGLNDTARKLVQSLIKVKPDNWSAAFDSWYFHHTLLAHYQSNSLNNDALMREMNAAETRLSQLMPTQIAHLWRERKSEAIREMKDKNAAGYRLFFHPKNREHAKATFLKNIIGSNISTLTDVFPVLLMTPQVASQIVEREGKEFDWAIFDNAQFISAKNALALLRNTEGVVALTESSEASVMLPDSVAAKMLAHKAPHVRLGCLHRPVSEATRRLNQFVFYKNLEIPLQGKIAQQEVFFTQTSGLFDATKRTNEAEIIETIRLIEDLHALPTNTFPRIGIVCMTKEQRNLLSDNFLHIIQKSLFGWEKIEQMQRNGLSILSIDEMVGMQFDVLIVNGTFSALENMALPLHRVRKLLNVFTQKLYWINSVPTSTLLTKATDKSHEQTFSLSNLILMGKFLAENDPPQYEGTFQRLTEHFNRGETPKPSVFVAEMVNDLARFVERTYLKSPHLLENQLFDLVILPKFAAQKPAIVRVDGKLSRSRYFSADWERRTLETLEKMQIPVFDVWSYHWWRNPKDEAFRLAQSVFAYDRQFEKKES